MNFYGDMKVKANGIALSEVDMPYKIRDLLFEKFHSIGNKHKENL